MSKVTKIGRDGAGLNALEKCDVVPAEAILSGFAEEMGDVHFESAGSSVVTDRVLLATNAFMAGHRHIKRRIVPIRDRVLATEPLTDA